MSTHRNLHERLTALKPVLLRAYQQETDWTVRATIARVLAFIPDRDIAAALVDQLIRAEPHELMHLQQTLGSIGEPAAQALFAVLNRNHHPDRTLLYVAALGFIGEPSVVSYLESVYVALRDMLHNAEKDSTKMLRIQIAKSLECAGRESLDVLPVYARMLDDPAPGVRAMAVDKLFGVLNVHAEATHAES